MDNKENNQDDLVVSSTGEMLTKGESEQRQIEVKEEPQAAEVQTEDVATQDTQAPQDQATAPPTGLAPPDMPQAAPETTEQPDIHQAPQEETEVDDSSTPQTAQKDSGMSDEEFASKHSNHERTAVQSSHHTRNNKKVLAGLIVVGALVICAIAVFVYLSTQENVAEVQPVQQVEVEEPVLEESEDTSLPVDEGSNDEADTQLEQDTVEEPTDETVPTDQEEALDPIDPADPNSPVENTPTE